MKYFDSKDIPKSVHYSSVLRLLMHCSLSSNMFLFNTFIVSLISFKMLSSISDIDGVPRLGSTPLWLEVNHGWCNQDIHYGCFIFHASMRAGRQLCKSLQDFISEVFFFNLDHCIKPAGILILLRFQTHS